MEEWSKNLKIDLMKNVTYNAFKMAKNNEEFLIIGEEMFLEYGSVNENEVEEKLIEVINEELREENLLKWKDNDRGVRRRRNCLENLLLGIQRRDH